MVTLDEFGAPAEVWICAVCGTVLDFDTRPKAWKHPSWMVKEDHVAVPVRQEDAPAQLQGHCDFCFEPQPKWELPVRSFETPAPGFGSAGAWAACEHCAHLIRMRNWQELTAHSIKSWEGRHGPMMDLMKGEIRRLYRMVRDHQAGELTRL